MSLDCQQKKIKANKSNDKSMLRQTKWVYILNTIWSFLGHPVLKLLAPSQFSYKDLDRDFF
jgi:hypothetical protein